VKVTLIAVPYDLGRERVGSGRGPEAYLANGAEKALRGGGNDVETAIVQRAAPFANELEAVLDVNAALATLVAQAVTRGRLPLVLAGNCNATLGVHAGLVLAGVGGAAWGQLVTVWLDAHGDFNTPETTLTGYLDGMPLAMLVGAAHPEAWETLKAAPQSAELVLHAGGRDLDPAEDRALAASQVILVSGREIQAHGLAPAAGGAARC
jgi:arginase